MCTDLGWRSVRPAGPRAERGSERDLETWREAKQITFSKDHKAGSNGGGVGNS